VNAALPLDDPQFWIASGAALGAALWLALRLRGRRRARRQPFVKLGRRP
jgi:hypothetical protein